MAYFSAFAYSTIELHGGEDFSTTVIVNENGVPIDTTGVQNMVFKVRRSYFYDKDVYTFTVTKITPYTSGAFLVTYPASETKNMKAGRHVFDFFIDIPLGTTPETYRTIKAAKGIIVVYPAATIGDTTYYPF